MENERFSAVELVNIVCQFGRRAGLLGAMMPDPAKRAAREAEPMAIREPVEAWLPMVSKQSVLTEPVHPFTPAPPTQTEAPQSPRHVVSARL